MWLMCSMCVWTGLFMAIPSVQTKPNVHGRWVEVMREKKNRPALCVFLRGRDRMSFGRVLKVWLASNQRWQWKISLSSLRFWLLVSTRTKNLHMGHFSPCEITSLVGLWFQPWADRCRGSEAGSICTWHFARLHPFPRCETWHVEKGRFEIYGGFHSHGGN